MPARRPLNIARACLGVILGYLVATAHVRRAAAIEIKATVRRKLPTTVDREIVKKWDRRSPQTHMISADNAGGAKVVLPVGGKVIPAP